MPLFQNRTPRATQQALDSIYRIYLEMASSSLSSFKEQKELFVSGLEGTSAGELILICWTSVTGTLFYTSVAVATVVAATQTNARFVWLLLIGVELLAFGVPSILCQTVWLYPYGVCYMAGQVVVALPLVVRAAAAWTTAPPLDKQQHHHNQQRTTTQNRELTNSKDGIVRRDDDDDELLQQEHNNTAVVVVAAQRMAVTLYRSCLMGLTVTAILAVDFHVFPRRFGKTETVGTSLMDLGAASFVIAAGMVSTRARTKFTTTTQNPSPTLHHQQPSKAHYYYYSILPLLRKNGPLLFMGLLRLATHKGIDYPEHASEYGVHWNFFFTLAFLTTTTTTASNNKQKQPGWQLPLALATVYQLALSSTALGLQTWVEEAPRTCSFAFLPVDNNNSKVAFLWWLHGAAHVGCDLFAANREGILGCIGYTALYWASEWMAYSFFWNSHPSLLVASRPLVVSRNPFVAVADATTRLWTVVFLLLGLWRLGVYIGLPISRRTTNIPFCIWALFVNLLQLTAIYSITLWWHVCTGTDDGFQSSCREGSRVSVPKPTVLSSVNRNGLVIFVVANLLTGAVNLSINTLQVGNLMAVGILSVYLCTVATLAICMDRVREYFPRRKSVADIAVPTKQD